MTTNLRHTTDPTDCSRFEAQLGAYMERDLDATAVSWMQRHRAECARCEALTRELDQLVAEAAALPVITPPRDLWGGIEARLESPVRPLRATSRDGAVRRTRSVSVQWFAVAATLLVAVSSGVTWQLTRARATGNVRGADTAVAVPLAGPLAIPVEDAVVDGNGPARSYEPTAELMLGSAIGDAPTRATTQPTMQTIGRRRASDDDADAPNVDRTYEREIAALRRIVDERFTELDPATVTELRRNLDIIDRAIGDSRAALANDPRSGVVSAQLDRALQAKLELLRRVALL